MAKCKSEPSSTLVLNLGGLWRVVYVDADSSYL